MKKLLLSVYQRLLNEFGHQNWWPGETKDEIIIGAILTQSVSWKNVEKALMNLEKHHLLNLRNLYRAEPDQIAPLIRSTLYYNQKTIKLLNFCNFLHNNFDLDLEKMFKTKLITLRTELLKIKGIGEETADSILLYAGELPIFVIDAYTKRVFSRLGIVQPDWTYQQLQRLFMENLPTEVELYKDFHAQIVQIGKNYCTRKPGCELCVLKEKCEKKI